MHDVFEPNIPLLCRMDLALFKQNIIKHCHAQIEQRINTAKEAIAMAKESSEDDTKSSAGDKYETGREMMQQEINRNEKLLSEALKIQHTLNSATENNLPTERIGIGHLITTDKGYFFFAAGIGTVTVDGQKVFALSPTSPIGQLMLGKQTQDTIAFNKIEYQIKSIQ